jgi:hypothetical protein
VLLAAIPQAANKPALRARIREAARKVHSDFEYRRLMDALEKIA